MRDLSVHRWFLNVALPPSSVRCSSLTQSSRSQEGWSPLPPCVSPSPHRRCTRDATPHLHRPLWCVSRALAEFQGELASRWFRDGRSRCGCGCGCREHVDGTLTSLALVSSALWTGWRRSPPSSSSRPVLFTWWSTALCGTLGGLSSPVNRSQARRSIERGNRLGFAVRSLCTCPPALIHGTRTCAQLHSDTGRTLVPVLRCVGA